VRPTLDSVSQTDRCDLRGFALGLSAAAELVANKAEAAALIAGFTRAVNATLEAARYAQHDVTSDKEG
jgi:hypothetical protein